MQAKRYLCLNCKNTIQLSAKPKRSFMGFQRIPCPSCQKECRYPLTTGYVVFYWIWLLGNVGWFAHMVSQGETIVPNPIGIVVLIYMFISLVKSRTLKLQIADLEGNLPRK
jgi:hypothetical protein